jgi:1-deoxy-D-xylulose-5-phosphate synthase
MGKILDKVNRPEDLSGLSWEELDKLAEEIRALIISTVSNTGGHLAANLGVVELTIALLRVFSPPVDKIVWDVSHQSYTYKILTDRKDRFNTLRQFGGISGFLRRDESKYDAFGAGHSGTALSAALGMAVGRDRRGGQEHIVAVLGDGSAGCGISYEALNNLAGTTRRLIVVLNDNEMSISANVGSLSRYLGGLLASPRYNRWKKSVEKVASRLHMGLFRSMYYRLEEAIKSLFLRSVLFEEFGLRYIGPIDGHNVNALVDALSIAGNSDRPIVLHVSTQKGKGYRFAEDHPEKWHGTSGFDVESGASSGKRGSQLGYSDVFGSVMERLAEQDPKIVAITAAMAAGTGLSGFAERFPERFFDVGISEEHAVVFAAGLATEGLLPVFVVYSTFMQRAVDCVVHDVCLQGLPVVLCLDRAGIVGDDGPTHHGVFDISMLRSVPGLIIMQPLNEAELAHMLFTATKLGRPVAIRYPRGLGPGVAMPDEFTELAVGRADVVRKMETEAGHSERVWIWAIGDMVQLAERTADLLKDRGIAAGVVNARFVNPLDTDLLRKHGVEAPVIATMENGVRKGGFGTGVEEFLVEEQYSGRVVRFGWPDEFVPHGPAEVLMQEFGLVPETMASVIAGPAKTSRARNDASTGG